MSANRRRKLDKRRRRQHLQHQRERAARATQVADETPGDEPDLESIVEQVARAMATRRGFARRLVGTVIADPRAPEVLARVIARHWRTLQAAGWTDELARHAARRLGARHARWLIERERADAQTGIELLAWLFTLPRLPAEVLPPRKPRDDRLLARVRALLAKAESTEFPEEAEALSAKAQELVSRHSLQDALTADAERDRPGLRRVLLEDPYAEAKGLLLDVVAQANRCRSVIVPKFGFSNVVGFDTDLYATEVLFTSLLVQATRAMTAAGRTGWAQRQPSFRRSFLAAYAHRIGERLDRVKAQAIAEVADERLLPVLAARRREVDEALDEAFPRLVSSTISASNGHGWAAGRAAADQADLAAFDQLRAS